MPKKATTTKPRKSRTNRKAVPKPTALLFKVLSKGGKSTFQGFAWPLPKNGKPGKWVVVDGEIGLCCNGPHLTCLPLIWRKEKSRLFVAEGMGKAVASADKVVFEKARLLYEVTPKMAAQSSDYHIRAFFPKPKADLSGANLSWANLYRANLSGAGLSWANLSWANLSWANLSWANLYRANLSGANLSGTNLYGANLSWADLSWADLSRANLSGANLSWADLSWANLSKANLSKADLSGANLSRANLSGANLSKADLSGANLSRANLSGANLYRANLSKADLSGADLSGAYRPKDAPNGWQGDKDGRLKAKKD